MKTYKLLLFMLILVFCINKSYAQIPKNQAEADALARRILTMTPAQMMKFRDSMVNAVKQQQARIIPNGNQLLLEHHYDTAYTTVRFYYSKQQSQYTTKSGGHSNTLITGKSAKAIMLREANGHTVISCSLNPPGANTTQIDKGVNALNKSLKYMTPAQQLAATNLGRQTAFGSAYINNNTISGSASENGLYSGGGGNTIITTRPPVINMAFSFIYDPVEGFSTVSVGATYHRHTEGSDDKGNHNSSDDTPSAGMGGQTDPHEAHLTGASAPQQSDPNEAYIKVVKTARGFHIAWTKLTKYPDVNGKALETLTADIGEPDQQYEAMIHPMPDSKYEHWLPKGAKVDGTDDLKGDDSARFYVEVHDKNNPDKLYPGYYTVKYQLKDITHYKGITSNYPTFAAHADPDFKISDSIKYSSPGTFDPESVTDSTATSQPNKGNIAIVRLMCLDYGAWTKLTAEVTLDDGSVIKACPYYDKGETFITVPYDRDENKIADAWEKSEKILGKGYGLDWDEDVKPDNNHPGDNIPLIDEYRGFLIEDDNYKPVYKRFSPQNKELFTIGLADFDALNEKYKLAIKAGSQGYERASGVKTYHFTNSKYGQHEPGEPGGVIFGRWVNVNSPLQTYTRAVVINVNNAARDANDKSSASTVPIHGVSEGIGALYPEDTEVVSIWNQNVIKTSYKPEEYLPANGNPGDPNVIRKMGYIRAANAEFHVNIDPLHASDLVSQYYTQNLSRIITFSVTHEIGHATHMHHHHLSEPGEKGYYHGVANCPMRYWQNNFEPVNCSTWVAMFITGNWNPATLTTPWGINQPMQFCKTDDNCFGGLMLKKH
ncbi:hypothetical protein [Mucilaginibacter sp.]|uniref:hypothetical protein n=1 Tax=Mucilaginibacter sp. TaxID=1882438 RepID=UPI003D0AE536